MLVTGATGFIGARLCSRLLGGGAKVYGLSRREAPPASGSPIKWLRADLADRDEVSELVSSLKPDCVFHLASHVSGAAKVELVRPTLESNLLGTVNLLEAVERSGSKRIVVAGTMMEPGGTEAANSPYAAAKSAASGYARMFHALYGTPVTVMRVFMVYGPGQPDPRKLIPHAILSLLRGESPQISSGVWEVDWVFVDDVVDSLVAAALSDDAAGQTVDVASGEMASIRAVVEQIADIVGSEARPEFGAVGDRPLERPIVPDLEHSEAVLGWRPATSLDHGLRQTVDWYRRQLPAC